jgi:hypothetical protein
MINLEHITRSLLNQMGNAVAMLRAKEKRPQYQQVERALQKFYLLLIASLIHHEKTTPSSFSRMSTG